MSCAAESWEGSSLATEGATVGTSSLEAVLTPASGAVCAAISPYKQRSLIQQSSNSAISVRLVRVRYYASTSCSIETASKTEKNTSKKEQEPWRANEHKRNIARSMGRGVRSHLSFSSNRELRTLTSSFDHKTKCALSSNDTSIRLLCRVYLVFLFFASSAISLVLLDSRRRAWKKKKS